MHTTTSEVQQYIKKPLSPMFCTLLFNHQYNKLYNTLAQYIGLSHVALLEILLCKICTVDKTVNCTLKQFAGTVQGTGGTMFGKL